jgi:hypothetical protein
MSTFINRKDDAGRCSVCRFDMVKGDEIRADGTAWKHERCAQDLDDGHIVEWRTAESIERAGWEEREAQRIAPLDTQGACPLCQIELPRSGVCDDHGRP